MEPKLRITVDIFSGRENPVIEITGAELQKITERFSIQRQLQTREVGHPPVSALGYRGLIIEQTGTPLKGLPPLFRLAAGTAYAGETSFVMADEKFEEVVHGKLPKTLPLELIHKEMGRYKKLHGLWNQQPHEHDHDEHKEKCHCAPVYEPAWWNVPARQPFNNCYNYASNYRTNTFAQPGRAAGHMYTALHCAEVKAGAIADELIDQAGANNHCPEEGHLVALVIWPGVDFHWYRKGKNGLWSHKPGGTPVTNVDNSGHVIPDPHNANRGGYTDFCTFMVVKQGHIKIQ